MKIIDLKKAITGIVSRTNTDGSIRVKWHNKNETRLTRDELVEIYKGKRRYLIL